MLDKDLRELLALFNTTGVEFLVVGGHAVAFHGRPRLTAIVRSNSDVHRTASTC